MHTGYTQYPSIYVGEEHVGGVDDLKSHLLNEQSTLRLFRDNGIQQGTSTTDFSDFEDGQYRGSKDDQEFQAKLENILERHKFTY